MIHMDNLIILQNVGISKGRDDVEAVKFDETTQKTPKASFNGFKGLYDAKAENRTKWLNYFFVAYGDVASKMQKMGLKEKSFVNIVGHLDQNHSVASDGTKRTYNSIVIDQIEYTTTGPARKGEKTPDKAATVDSVEAEETEEPAVTAETIPPKAGFKPALDAGGYAGSIDLSVDEPIPFDL